MILHPHRNHKALLLRNGIADREADGRQIGAGNNYPSTNTHSTHLAFGTVAIPDPVRSMSPNSANMICIKAPMPRFAKRAIANVLQASSPNATRRPFGASLKLSAAVERCRRQIARLCDRRAEPEIFRACGFEPAADGRLADRLMNEGNLAILCSDKSE